VIIATGVCPSGASVRVNPRDTACAAVREAVRWGMRL